MELMFRQLEPETGGGTAHCSRNSPIYKIKGGRHFWGRKQTAQVCTCCNTSLMLLLTDLQVKYCVPPHTDTKMDAAYTKWSRLISIGCKTKGS